ncbi:MAG TPA: c-type cytochrome [Thermoanaerobaculia bacterium]|nr:c-type cytochrome [Thermoanaerobaculia bacterium]
MRAKLPMLPKMLAGGLLVAGLAVPAAMTAWAAPQYGQAPPAAAPAPMPSHESEAQPGEMAPKPGAEAQHPNKLRDLIKGKEDQPAETVFKNVQVLKGLSVGHFMDAMEGFNHALGTNCRKCHDTENFSSDDKKDKKIAREMVQMTQGINEKYIKAMPDLDKDAHVGCFTCHHGQSHPNAQPKESTEKSQEKPQG